jgi:ATP-dependent RNA helicase RhlE
MNLAFADMQITRQFLDALDASGIVAPTEIQRKAIVPAMAGQDILGIAETGSGKTLAFLLPLAMKLKFAREGHPLALVLAPSKELAMQIHRSWVSLTANTDLRAACLYGGVGKKTQVAQLEAGVELVISTPGRLIDLYSYGHVHLRQVRTLVLDEADRMMEMGFMPQLRRILEIIPVKRQNLLFSATFPERVEVLAAEFLEFPTRIESEAHGKPVASVSQQWYAVPNFRTKLILLERMLDESWGRVMVFCRTRDVAERVAKYLERQRHGTVRVLHANKGQHTRINALDAFRDGEVKVLVTTDVSSRGIDIDDVSHVVNFEVPYMVEDYLHRIGRTARVNRQGVAITLANEAEVASLQGIAAKLGAAMEQLDLPEGLHKAPDLPGERQEILRALDTQRQRADPSFQGAFHEKKRKPDGNRNKGQKPHAKGAKKRR